MQIKKRYLAAMLVSLMAIAAVTAAPTYSWLVSQSETVTNHFTGATFSVGLDEGKVDEYGRHTDSGETRVAGGQDYKYFAGSELDKDPTVTISAGSEECWVYVCVVDGLTITDFFTVEDLRTDCWEEVAAATDSAGNAVTLYRYKETVDASGNEEGDDIRLEPIFTKISVSTELTAEDVETLNERQPTVSVTALAVQAANMAVETADETAMAAFGETVDGEFTPYSWAAGTADGGGESA